MYSCTECGRCSSHCPATHSGKELAPRQLLLEPARLPLRARGRGPGAASRPDGDGAEAANVGENIVGERLIHDEVLWACTTCRACEEACPVMIEYVDKIVDMRRHLVQEESRFPAELTRTFKGMETQSNPWGVDAAQRDAWADGLGHPDHGRQAGRRVPLLRRLRRRRSTIAPSARRRRSPRSSRRPASTSPSSARRSCATARRRAASATSTSSRRWRRCASRCSTATSVQEDHHQLPALLQHAQERVPAVRRQLRGHPRHRVRAAADRRRQDRVQRQRHARPSPTTTPATSAATTTSTTRRATSCS